jgi:hypothetical protein
MKFNNLRILTLVVLGLVGSLPAQQTITKQFSVKKNDNLTLKVIGEIEVTVWDKQEVVIEIAGVDEDDTKGLSVAQNGNTITVNTEQAHNSDLSFNIKIPESCNLSLKTSGGEILCHGNIDGAITAKTAGGNIVIGSATGQIDLKTAGGDIIVGDAGHDVFLSTSGGDISTGNIHGTAKITTSGGDIKLGNIGGELRAATSGGDIRVGSVNGYCKLASSGGDIHMEKCLGSLSAATSGGSISLLDVQGAVSAVTSGGDVVVELTGNPKEDSKLVTSGGKITVSVADNVHATVQATISYDSSERDNVYKVYSDFKVTRERSNDYELQKEYEINGGGSVVRLKTNGNDIVVKKLLK